MAGLSDLWGGDALNSINRGFADNSNSLVGLGLGMMSYPTMSMALQGYEAGARTDSANQYHRAALAQQQREHDKNLALQREQMAQNERHFGVTSQLPSERAAQAMGLQRGSPEYSDFLKTQLT